MSSTTSLRLGVGAIIFHREHNCVLMGKRISSSEQALWQFPQGGLESTDRDTSGGMSAVYREILEETGIPESHLHFLSEYPSKLTYFTPAPFVRDGVTYYGQKQSWFYLKLTTNNTLQSYLDKASDKEFSELDWIPLNEVLDLSAPFRASVYDELIRFSRTVRQPTSE